MTVTTTRVLTQVAVRSRTVVASAFNVARTLAIRVGSTDVTTIATVVRVAGAGAAGGRHLPDTSVVTVHAVASTTSVCVIVRRRGGGAACTVLLTVVQDGSIAGATLTIHVATSLLATVLAVTVVGYISIAGVITAATVVLGVVETVVPCGCSSSRTLTEGVRSAGVASVATGVLCSDNCIATQQTLVAVTEVGPVLVSLATVGTLVQHTGAVLTNVTCGAVLLNGVTVATCGGLAKIAAGAGAVVASTFVVTRTLTVRIGTADVTSIGTVVGVAAAGRCASIAIQVSVVALQSIAIGVAIRGVTCIAVVVACAGTGVVRTEDLSMVQHTTVCGSTLTVSGGAYHHTTVGTSAVVGDVTVASRITTSTVVLVVVQTVVTCGCLSSRALTKRTGTTGVTPIATGVLRSDNRVVAVHTLVAITEVGTVLVGLASVSTLVQHTSTVAFADIARVTGRTGVTASAVLACLTQTSLKTRAVIASAFDSSRTLTVGAKSADVATIVTVIGVACSCGA